MRFKKYITLTILTAGTLLLAGFTMIKTTGAHPGSTGAPGDQTCAQSNCHGGHVAYDPVGINSISFSSGDSTYVAGQTYSLTVKVQKSGHSKFGFEIVALRNSDSTNTGQFTITDAPRTHILNYLSGTDNRYSVTHSAPGTPEISSGYNEWTMNWTAPPSNEGPIIFYYATNCTNNNGGNDGDNINVSSFTITPKVTSVEERNNIHELFYHYDTPSNSLIVKFDTKGRKKTKVKLVDQKGSLIFSDKETNLEGAQTITIKMPQPKIPGIYFLELKLDDNFLRKKVLIH